MPLHPHLLFELLAFTIGFQVFRILRRATKDPVPELLTRIWLIAAAAAGGALGAKGLVLFADPWTTWGSLEQVAGLLSGRTIVGALLGGWLAVELAKVWLRVRVSTGDLYVVPLCVGMALGRVGCFLSGVSDGTHGLPTALPVGMDLGDGVPRHPTALYEIGVLAVLAVVLGRWTPPTQGLRFRVFLGAYLLWRLVIDGWKPGPAPYGGLTAIQLACLLGLVVLLVTGLRSAPRAPSGPPA
ncbi:MAG: prolipoprotein diacylglyceryl transferase [Myxococcales bacterium]|nr:prolipoprotein diacylglyceryl transferase [Myxococcales bacterium]